MAVTETMREEVGKKGAMKAALSKWGRGVGGRGEKGKGGREGKGRRRGEGREGERERGGRGRREGRRRGEGREGKRKEGGRERCLVYKSSSSIHRSAGARQSL